MLLRLIRGIFVLATTAVAVPYSLAIVANVLNGWPQNDDKYKRALHPKKVLKLNYVLVQMIKDKTKYIALLLKWKHFYRNTDPERVYKNLTFGRNDCTMDMYLPTSRNPQLRAPVIIFVYGGSWSSGDKSMYGLLCSQIVAATGAITICPNYSLYPKGYVDDMIQDVVDCLSWVMENIEDYGGDKDRVVLVGHSAGAHLAAMGILELLHDERIALGRGLPGLGVPELMAGDGNEDMTFADHHYSSGSSGSFSVLSENGAGDMQTLEPPSGEGRDTAEANTSNNGLTDSTVVVEMTDLEARETTEVKNSEDSQFISDSEHRKEKKSSLTAKASNNSEDSEEGDGEEYGDDDSGDNDSVVTVRSRPKDIQRHATLVDMCRAVKGFVGLAGVYSIGDHFQHESSRGIEDVSKMSRAHYGRDHFKRFSPTEILTSLDKRLSLPPMVLVHGTGDYIVPVSSSQRFADALSGIHANVKVRIIPECDHYEICLDLMESDRKFYPHVMSILMETITAIS